MKKAKFNIPIYEWNVYVTIFEDTIKLDEYYRKLRVKLKYPIDEDEGLSQGLVLTMGFDSYLLLAENKISVNLLSHEVTHIAFKIFNTNNISIEESEENFALLTGFINEKVFKIINKLGCKI